MKLLNLILLLALTCEAKKKNPWKKTVGKKDEPITSRIWEDVQKKTLYAIGRIKKHTTFEVLIASQVALIIGVVVASSLFKTKKKKKKKEIERERFILLINLGYDKFKTTKGEIDDFVDQDKLCELVPEDDYDVVAALLQWDFTDEMELEDDNLDELRQKWNQFALDFRSSEAEESSEADDGKIGLWRKHFENEELIDIARQLFI